MQLKDIQTQIDGISAVGDFTETHEAIAAFRIQHLKASVVETRMFLSEISAIYSIVKGFYFLAQGQVGKNKVLKDASLSKKQFIKKTGKRVSILLSANTGFYGGVLVNLVANFSAYVSTNDGDVAIVGRLGKELYKGNKSYTYFDLDDDKPEEEQIKMIIDYAKNYEAIIVHYVQFFSVLTQIPYYSNIAGEIMSSNEIRSDLRFVFEPSYEDILTFFESQILEAIFRQKVYEHQLARYGGKLVAMDDAVASSKGEVAKLNHLRIRLKKRILNKKQQEVFSSLLGLYQEY